MAPSFKWPHIKYSARRVLAVETSCDDTAVAVIENGGKILSNIVTKQHRLHAKYGGIVPQVASQAHRAHLPNCIYDALQTAGVGLCDIDFLAVTRGPGLSRCLATGFDTINTLAAIHRIPCFHINHLVSNSELLAYINSYLLGGAHPCR